MKKVLLMGLLLSLLTSCLKDDEFVDYGPIDEQIITEYLKTNDIDAERDDSGLYYKIIEKGTGDPIGIDAKLDEYVTFSYKAYLTNGNVFTDTKGENITSNLWSLLYGLQYGLPKINRQGEIHLYIPSKMAYGSSFSEGVPANSVVILEVKVDRDQADIDEEIIVAYLEKENITDVIRDKSGLYYKIIEEGAGENVPDNALIDVSYRGKLLDGTIFNEGTLNNAPLDGLIEAWKIGIPKLKKGSRAVFYCPSQLGYGSFEKEKIPSNSILIYEVNIVNF